MNNCFLPKVQILSLLAIFSLVHNCRVNSFTNYAHHPKTARPEHAKKPPKLKPKENREKHEEFLEHCRNGHTNDLIEMRYNYNIDLNYRSHKHHMETPLMAAIIHENYLVVEYLLHAGVDTTLNARHGRTPMHAAAELGFADILELLIEHGVGDVNERHDDGYRPLHRAVLGQ